ncbi:hypothetical protein [Falsiroseomonas tokyonensis]|uniref:Uncharacterized protein n=1 Tax=Falsiroseomonas tokyonensis TaxID=430521 RepID=A0ABV7BSB9_9PROT|nr:hypothetical protein [Falsiroseomonas tokyonensis]MBU8537534.1 hypothetical protein [Falsiroseomonas tokyonensis]
MRRLLLAALLLPPAALAETLDGISFEAPAGWQRQEQRGGLVFTRPLPAEPGRRAARPGNAMIVLRRPGPATGDFEAAMNGWARAPEQLAEARPRRRDGETLEGGRFRIEERSGSRPTLRAVHIGLEQQGRRVLLALLLVNPPREAGRAARQDFAAMVRSLRLNGDGRGFVLDPPRGGGAKLEGHFTRMQTGVVPNAFGGMDFRADMRSLTFSPDGLFRSDPPAAQSLAEACAAEPRGCGTYTLSGGTITLREVEDEFGRVSRRTLPIARQSNGITLDGANWRRVEPFAPGTRLDGLWRHTFASSGSTAFSSGSVAVERSLALSRDGSYRRTGWSGASSTSEVGGGRSGVTTSAPRRDSSGRYELSGHVLLLRDEAGREERLSIFRGDPDSENLLVINGQNYLRR